MKTLLRAMTPEAAESAIASLFDLPPVWEEVEVTGCVTDHPAPWTIRFSAAFIATARQRVQSRADEAALRWATALSSQACSIPAEAFALALAPWELAAPEQTTAWIATTIRKEIDLFTATIKTRQDFLTELNAQ